MNLFLTAFLLLGSSALLSWPLGRFLARVLDVPPGPGADCFGRGLARWGGSALGRAQSWRGYGLSLLAVNAGLFLVSGLILAAQSRLPLNPDGMGPLSWHLLFHTVSSFVTNTNLQHYSGESALSYLSQLGALMWLQFTSAATGLAALAALARGLSGRPSPGNFHADFLRATLLVLLPLAAGWALLLVLAGVPMTFSGAAVAHTLEGPSQTIARGPVAAFVAIKQLGTNGGGFFGTNSAHPLENPGVFSNLLQMVALLVLPMACVWFFGRMTGRLRHAAVLFAVLLALAAGKITLAGWAEAEDPAALRDLPVARVGFNWEGKELRLGAATGPLWAVLTTCTSNGSVAAMHDSLTPLAGLAPLLGMWLNETFGGVGVGMINLFLYLILTVFLAGLLIGRSPEYLGRRIEVREMRLTVLALVAHPLLILGGTALFAATSWGAGTVLNPGPQGFTEILYEFSSAAANNGSGFEGLGDNTLPWNLATGLVMLLARFLPILLPLAVAGSLASKKPLAEGVGSLPSDGPTFGLMLLGTVLLSGALTFFPVALLGPVAEHLLHR